MGICKSQQVTMTAQTGCSICQLLLHVPQGNRESGHLLTIGSPVYKVKTGAPSPITAWLVDTDGCAMRTVLSEPLPMLRAVLPHAVQRFGARTCFALR